MRIRAKGRSAERSRLAAIACVSMAVFATTTQAALPACDLQSFKAPADTTLVAAKSFTTPVNYCRIDGYVTTNNPGPNKVNFMIALPEKNNGRYLLTIPGGAGGFVPDPMQEFLTMGYAITSTDKGVKAANTGDFSFRKDPAQSLDWGHRGVHVTAQATQALVRDYYKIAKLYRYAAGCSGGGDGTLASAELHPQDFDGYVGGAMTTANLEITQIWGAIAQRQHQDPNAWMSPDNIKKTHQALLAEYDGADGAMDGLIWEPWKIQLKRQSLSFLTDAQFETLKFIQEGFKPELGTWYPGFWLANVTGFPPLLTGMAPPPWKKGTYPGLFTVTDTGTKALYGPNFNALTDIDYGDRKAVIADRDKAVETGRHVFDPKNLAGLKASSSKMILWTGMAENAVPPGNIVGYTQAATTLYGDAGRQQFMRTFLAPGLLHCFGGEGAPTDVPAKMLEAAAAWVEKGIAPDAVVVSNPTRKMRVDSAALVVSEAPTAPATRTYLLCSYPKHAMFAGNIDNPKQLDMNDAKNWRCEDE